jgi:hypothetical protein
MSTSHAHSFGIEAQTQFGTMVQAPCAGKAAVTIAIVITITYSKSINQESLFVGPGHPQFLTCLTDLQCKHD